MAQCLVCGKSGFGFLEVKEGKCPQCRKDEARIEEEKTARVHREEAAVKHRAKKAAHLIILTTEATVGEVERLGIVSAEVVLGMNIFKDVLANIRDIFGGRSGVVQQTLEEARNVAFEELRVKAAVLGANAVVAVDIDYHSISTGSSVNMMMVAVSGTAVRMT